MKRKKVSGSGLFLLEMMLSILFFSISAAVCVQVYAKAHLRSREAGDLNQAVICVSSAAEVLLHEGVNGLLEQIPEPEKAEDGVFCLYYTEDWMPTEAKQAYARLTVSVREQEEMLYGELKASRMDGTEIYSLDVRAYLPVMREEAMDDPEGRGGET